MPWPHLSFVIEVTAACLLVVMIVYAAQLNRRLNNLQADKEQLMQLIARFNESTARAEASIGKLRAAAADASAALQERVAEAGKVREDLLFLTERASQGADRLERVIGNSRVEPLPQPVQNNRRREAGLPAFTPLKKQATEKPERGDVLRALRGVR